MESLNHQHQHHINVGNDEESAALVMATLGNSGKRKMDHPDAAAGGAGLLLPSSNKVPRAGEGDFDDAFEPIPFRDSAHHHFQLDHHQQQQQQQQQPQPSSSNETGAVAATADGKAGELKPYPYFYYIDYSQEPDKDSLTPLTPPGRVPNFPSKMHAMLGREDLKSMISWVPHGRAFKVHDSKEFEKKILPIYFEHAKYSSFIRQANGWGFRRITTGKDRNAYYHPRFLRGLPHLCKDMKRPGVNKKLAADPEHEPDLARISQEHPLPTNAVTDESILLPCTVQNGPKARMPILSGSLLNKYNDSTSMWLAPNDHEFMTSFQSSLGASEQQLQNNSNAPSVDPTTMGAMPLPIGFTNQQQQHHHQSSSPPSAVAQAAASEPSSTTLLPSSSFQDQQIPKITSLSAANQLAFSNATAQFAAGFAAAMGMFGPPSGTGPPPMMAAAAAAAMFANNGGGEEAHQVPTDEGQQAPPEAPQEQQQQQQHLVPLAPMPPAQYAPAPLPTHLTALAPGDAQQQQDHHQQPQFFPAAPPISPTNELKSPPSS